MKNSGQHQWTSHQESFQIKDTKNRVSTEHHTQGAYTKSVGKNPAIDRRLLDECKRLVRRSDRSVSTHRKGANYHLSHPLASTDKPTDACHRGKRTSDTERT